MFLNPIEQDNLAKLRRFGYTVIEPDSGYLACGDIGAGKMPSEKTLFDWIMQTIGAEKDLAGQKILVTAGATAEKIDPVRFITNHSTGEIKIGQRHAITVVVSMSSAMPFAILPMTFALAGAMSTMSARFASATCSTLYWKLRSNVSMRHLLPVKVSNVMG